MFAPLAGYKTYIAAIVAVASALVAALDGDMTWSAASAVITPAIIGAALRHGLSSTLAAILPSVIDALAKAADGAKKTAAVLLAAILLASQLTACASLGLTGNPIADAPAIAADVTKGCQVYAKVAAPLAIAPDPTLQAYVAFGGGLCDIATGNVLATAVPNIDKNTGLWITAITGALQAASTAVPATVAPAAPVAPATTVAAPVAK